MAARKRKISHGTAVHRARAYPDGTLGVTSLCDAWIAAEGILSTVEDGKVTCKKCLAWRERHASPAVQDEA